MLCYYLASRHVSHDPIWPSPKNASDEDLEPEKGIQIEENS